MRPVALVNVICTKFAIMQVMQIMLVMQLPICIHTFFAKEEDAY